MELRVEAPVLLLALIKPNLAKAPHNYQLTWQLIGVVVLNCEILSKNYTMKIIFNDPHLDRNDLECKHKIMALI